MEATGIMQSRKPSHVPISLASKSLSPDLHVMFLESPPVHWPTISGNYKRTFHGSTDGYSEEGDLFMTRKSADDMPEPLYQEFVQTPKRLKSEDSTLSSSLKEDVSTCLDSVDGMQLIHEELHALASSKGSTFFRRSGRNSSWMLQQPTSPCSYNPLDEPSPLGLSLRKSPSLLELISMSVAQGSSNSGLAVAPTSDAVTQGFIKNKDPTILSQDKLKASNFPASVLKIGTWECHSRYEGDLVAKCYYAKRKLVWEVLENGLKSKIEIQWSDISAMKAYYPENEHGRLEIEVSRPPLFFRELNPQPRKHTLWQTTSDFTGGEATISRHHCLQFLEGVLNRHYEKLLQCDPRLKAIANTGAGGAPVTSLDEPHASCQFLKCETGNSIMHDSLRDKSFAENSSKADESLRYLPLIPKLENDVQLVQTPSPSSVIDTRGAEETGSSDGDICIKEESSSGIHSEVLHLMPAYETSNSTKHELHPCRSGCIEENIEILDRNVLDEISRALFGEPLSVASQEEAFTLATMSASLSQYAHTTSGAVPLNDFPELYTATCFPSGLHIEGLRSGVDDDMHDVKPFRENIFKWECSAVDNSSDLSKPWLRKDSSSGDLLVNLPRIASLPQFFDSHREKPF